MGRKKGTHYYGRGPTWIHTDRDPPSCRAKEECKFQKHAPKLPSVTSKAQNAHHIIPVSALLAYRDDPSMSMEVRKKIDSVYRGTDYCTNRKHNIIYLPKKDAYVKLARRIKGNVATEPWGYGLPCHDWDHPEYTREVVMLLEGGLWGQFGAETVSDKCPDPETVQNAFEELEDYLRDELKRRGRRVDGGVTMIREHILGGTPDAEWYRNYSMADDDRERSQPAFDFASKIVRGLSRKRK